MKTARKKRNQLLTDDFVRTLRRLTDEGKIPQVRSEFLGPRKQDALLSVFENLGSRPMPYADLRAAVGRANERYGQRLGHFFEADHLLEKRFLESMQVETSLDQGDMVAILVPKNAAVARRLRIDGHGYEYIHAEKTAT